jgi:hypothetical protein
MLQTSVILEAPEAGGVRDVPGEFGADAVFCVSL